MPAIHSTRGLSDLAIKRMKKGQDDLLDSGENSGLRVTKGTTGKTTFIYRYKSPLDQRVKQYKIGEYPALSLSEARVELAKLKALRSTGVCPSTAKKDSRALKLQAQSTKQSGQDITLIQVVERYLAEYIEDKYDKSGRLLRSGARNLKGQRSVRHLLVGSTSKYGRKAGAEPKPMLVHLLGEETKLTEMTHKDIFDAVMSVVDRGASVSAGNMLRELSAAIDFCIGDWLPEDFVNPCYQAKAMLSRKKVKVSAGRRKRVLNDSELALLLAWLPSSKYTPTQKSVLQFTLMTGCRTGEIVTAEWRDIDLERGIWNLKANKTDTPRDVQLCRQAVDFLYQLKRITGEYVFPSQKSGKPIQQKSLTEQAWHMRRAGNMLDIDAWTPHDLRRSVRTGLARIGCPETVSEAILGHDKSGIEAVYNLHKYSSEAKLWLQRWNDHLDDLRCCG